MRIIYALENTMDFISEEIIPTLKFILKWFLMGSGALIWTLTFLTRDYSLTCMDGSKPILMHTISTRD